MDSERNRRRHLRFLQGCHYLAASVSAGLRGNAWTWTLFRTAVIPETLAIRTAIGRHYAAALHLGGKTSLGS